MSTLSLRLPESLHRQVKELAQQEGISINQLVSSALAEKISALQSLKYLEERAARGTRQKYDRALNKVKDIPADEADRL